MYNAVDNSTTRAGEWQFQGACLLLVSCTVSFALICLRFSGTFTSSPNCAQFGLVVRARGGQCCEDPSSRDERCWDISTVWIASGLAVRRGLEVRICFSLRAGLRADVLLRLECTCDDDTLCPPSLPQLLPHCQRLRVVLRPTILLCSSLRPLSRLRMREVDVQNVFFHTLPCVGRLAYFVVEAWMHCAREYPVSLVENCRRFI